MYLRFPERGPCVFSPLLQVGKETVKSSKDEILKKDMPPTFLTVEDASKKLLEASEGLRVDQSSQHHHVLLLEGARGTYSILPTYDPGVMFVLMTNNNITTSWHLHSFV